MAKRTGKKEDKDKHRIQNTVYVRDLTPETIKQLAHDLYVKRQKQVGGNIK